MRQIDCAHDAGISATLAVELAEMVSPKAAWVCSPETEDQQQQLDGGASAAAVAAVAETAAPAARGGLVAVLEDRFPREPSGGLLEVILCAVKNGRLDLFFISQADASAVQQPIDR